MHSRGASRFCRNFLSHRTETKIFVKEPFCFPEKLWYPKKLWIRGGISRFSVENFWSHSAEKFRGHLFNVSENLGCGKTLCIIGGITFFRQKFLVSQCRQILWASLQCFRKFGASKKFMHNRGYHVFPSKIFGLTVPKKIGISSMFQKICVIEKLYA